MTEIRLFVASQLGEVERQINNFLKSRPNIKVINVSVVSDVHGSIYNVQYIGTVAFSH